MPVTKEDLNENFSYLENIKKETLNDPGAFDSLAIFSTVGLSGYYENVAFDNFPLFVENFIENNNNYSFSTIIEDGDFLSLIYKYSFKKEETKTIENSWFELESLTLNKKKYDEFELWIKEKKENLYIFISDF